ncbi:hypothetical protein PMG11_08436 [Penicillium brasilianum]|uniref:Uncharacterized protein n=1 Tax=Penicillium brasilianum TaxID=104259 RepID=A0A0F7TSR5_PENBI|nr:hypothetical protein PMG11_08436 [Penicillium brasilianum]
MPLDTRAIDRHDSQFRTNRLRPYLKNNAWSGPILNHIYAGISVSTTADNISQAVIAVRDDTYLLDLLEHEFATPATSPIAYEHIISQLKKYSDEHSEKVLGVALSRSLHKLIPALCPQLWAELDIIPIVLVEEPDADATAETMTKIHFQQKTIDEQAESLARKCVRFFGPNKLPMIHVGFRGLVDVDSGFYIHIANKASFQQTVREKTWAALEHYASDLRHRRVKIAFFSATPQGGGVALMRHALVRLAHQLDLDLKWYVPKPRPGVFRITKTNHNILQGVSGPDDRLDGESQQQLIDWTRDNANRYWLRSGGPLSSPADGGADVVIVDDPQMTGLIPLAKEVDPQRPVIYRSHIQMRSDLIATPGTPQADVWEFIWRHIRAADVFISHPVDEFVPKNVPQDRVGYMPASTDWLDGLNKEMREWDTAFYGRQFNHMCKDSEMPVIDYPTDQYIVQIARFDPAKGILDVLQSYEMFHERLTMLHPEMKVPKLLICGHGSIDDPDGSIVYDAVLQHIEQAMPHLMALIAVIRLGPSDQLLNTLLSKAHIVLQLSSREGFEVKVSEALHKGKPIIATRAGGIPLQVEHERNGYLVDVGDTEAVARYLLMLWTDRGLYERMSAYALAHISDEVSTVGQALNWFFLSSKLSQGEEVLPHREWIQDLARRDLGQAYTKADGKLKRSPKDYEHS